ncbi:MAG TPA: protein kinase [Steroidobacteraceae bacterium]|jgi:serine/threonine protein kinase|nr:protein kinase [Steroidobacteraceae bacterium]
MNPVMRPAGAQPGGADETTIKTWLDALANGSCDESAFLEAMHDRFRSDPEGNWEVLSQLDQYYRRGRIKPEAFQSIKSALAEAALGIAEVRSETANPATDEVTRDTTDRHDAPFIRDNPGADAPEIPVARDVVGALRAEHSDAQRHREDTQSLDTPVDPRPGSVLRRRYRLETAVGQGASGTVFQALDEYRLDTPPGSQRLAIKVLHSAAAKRADLLAELRREFQHLQLLSHPNILRVFEFDRDGHVVFFTMELLNGALLSRVMQARKFVPLDRAHALALVRDLGSALAYAHSRGVVHGDLNPHEIFVTATGEVRILGFGGPPKVFAAEDQVFPLAASQYASSQILEGERPDARDDVFSLACIAYLLLTGEHPFSGKTALAARDARVNPRRAAQLDNRQWQALRVALRWKRDDRPADMQRWLDSLDLRTAARRPASLTDLLEAPPRRPRKSRLAVAIAAAAVLLLGVAYWFSSQHGRLPRLDTAAAPNPRAAAAPGAATPTPPTVPSVAATQPAAQSAAAKPPAAQPAAAKPPAAQPAAAKPPAAQAAAVPRTAAPEKSAARVAAAEPRASTTATGSSKIELAEDTVDVPANESSAAITVHRKGSLRGETSFTWWTESGTAKPGADFSPIVPQLAHIADGKASVTLQVLLSNAPHALPKSFYVVIDQSEGGAALGARTLTMVTLQPPD